MHTPQGVSRRSAHCSEPAMRMRGSTMGVAMHRVLMIVFLAAVGGDGNMLAGGGFDGVCPGGQRGGLIREGGGMNEVKSGRAWGVARAMAGQGGLEGGRGVGSGPLRLRGGDSLLQKMNAQIHEEMRVAEKKRAVFVRHCTDILRHFKPARNAGHGGEARERGRPPSRSVEVKDVRHHSQGRAEMLQAEEEEIEMGVDNETKVLLDDSHLPLLVQPSILKGGGALRDYQLEGLNWLARLYTSGISGVLADEMGLGKTVQTVAMIGYLEEFHGASGPHLVLAPKSTLNNWMREFEKWLPDSRVVLLQGNKTEREDLIRTRIVPGGFDVVLTSYEILLREKNHLKKFAWRYLAIDEAHRIKNEASQLSAVVRELTSHSRLLITGTPLQNSLHELWALLNFLMPQEFHSAEQFDTFFETGESATAVEQVTEKLKGILRPFMLRRLKAEVEKGLPPKKEMNLYVPLSQMQRTLYGNLLRKDIAAINGKGGERARLLNIVMQLKKACNHPYLFEGQEPGPPFIDGEHLIESAGKMRVLDKLLAKLRAKGSRVLIFCQMTRMLDILEDYCHLRRFSYCRLDGQTGGDMRAEMIDRFMKPDSDAFLFLLSTRAGGLGLNLQTADTVVLYDSDWNPQADIQAMDRAHRIGQKRNVTVYRFIHDKTVEEKVVERAFKKLFLDAVVIQSGCGVAHDGQKPLGRDELLEMVRFGADTHVRMGEETAGDDFDIDQVLEKGEERTEELTSRLRELSNKIGDSNFALDGGYNYKKDAMYEEEMNNTEGGKKNSSGVGGPSTGSGSAGASDLASDTFHLDLGRRRRAHTAGFYNEDDLFRQQVSLGKIQNRKESAPAKQVTPPRKLPRTMASPSFSDFQFFDQSRIEQLFAKRRDWWHRHERMRLELEEKRRAEIEVHGPSYKGGRVKAVSEFKVDGVVVDANEGLTAEEAAELKDKMAEGFAGWGHKEFGAFKRGCEKYGRSDYEGIASMVGKEVEEVSRYAEVFWRRGGSVLRNWKSTVAQIEKGEEAISRRRERIEFVRKVVSRYERPLNNLPIEYKKTAERRPWTLDADRFLLCAVAQVGNGRWRHIQGLFREAWAFRFDWFVLSRSVGELKTRFKALVRILQRSEEALEGGDKLISIKTSLTGRHESKYRALVRGPYKKKEGASGGGGGASGDGGGASGGGGGASGDGGGASGDGGGASGGGGGASGGGGGASGEAIADVGGGVVDGDDEEVEMND